MKKLSLVLAVLLLSGCATTTTTKVTKKAVTSGALKTNNQEYFDYLKTLDSAASTLVSESYNKVLKSELGSKKNKKELNKKISSAKKTYGNNLTKYAKMYGYKSGDAFMNDVIVPSIRKNYAIEKYLKKNLSSVVKKHNATWVKTVTVASEATADSAAHSSVKDFNRLYRNTKTRNDYGLVSDLSTVSSTGVSGIPSVLSKNLKNIHNSKGVYRKVMKSGKKYIVACVYNTKPSAQIKESMVSILSTSGIDTEVEAYYLKKNNFKVNDETLKKAVKKISKDFF